MRASTFPVVGLLLVGAGLAAACRDEQVVTPAKEAAPPTWSVARDESDPESLLITVRAATPCRILVRLEGVAEPAGTATSRPLAAGESLRLAVKAQVEDAPRASATPLPSDVQAGRTEAWVALLDYAWDDGLSASRREVVGTRPGRGRALGRWYALPPRAPQALVFGQDLDLAAVAVADGGAQATLEGRERGSRVQGALDAAQGDRASLLRVVLRAEKPLP